MYILKDFGDTTQKYLYIQVYTTISMRTIKITNQNLTLKDKIKTILEKTVTKFGNGAKIDCPKEYIGKKAYIIIRE